MRSVHRGVFLDRLAHDGADETAEGELGVGLVRVRGGGRVRGKG